MTVGTMQPGLVESIGFCSPMQPGLVVFSKCGRDKGRPFVVMSATDEYVYLSDGETRPLHKPKKKKARHVQPTHTVLDLSEAGPRALCDADIRKWLLPYKRR